MLSRPWRRLYTVGTVLWWWAFWGNPRGFNKPDQVGCTYRKYYHRWAQKHSQSHQEITPGCYSSKVLGTHPAHVFTVAYALSQTFSWDRATPIGASNHGDQNRERPSLLDKAIQHVAWTPQGVLTRKNIQSIYRALLVYAQAFKALIPDDQKGIAQYVPLSNEPPNTSHNQWHWRLLQPLEKSPRLTPWADLETSCQLHKMVCLLV